MKIPPASPTHPDGPIGSRQSLGDIGKNLIRRTLQIIDEGDILHTFSMWIQNPDFLSKVFMTQAGRLGYTQEETKIILSGVTSLALTRIVSLQSNNSGHAPQDSNKYGAVVFNKLPSTIENPIQLISQLFNTPGIIELYPSRMDDVSQVFSVLNHEINHLLMYALYSYRSYKSGRTTENIIKTLSSSAFQEITESLAWLDGGQILNFEVLGDEKVEKYVGWQDGGKYNIADPYERAKLRSYRLHKLQMHIHNLPDTTAEMYKVWCRKVRDILFAGVDNIEFLNLLDEYLDGAHGNYRQARDHILQIH